MALKTSNKNRKKVIEPVVEQPVAEPTPEVAPVTEDTTGTNSLVVMSIGIIVVILLAISYLL